MIKYKEIGGDFHLEINKSEKIDNTSLYEYINNLGYYYTLFDSGRSALDYLIINYINPKYKILLPSYMCESILSQFKKADYNIEFYKIDCKFQIDLEDLQEKITDEVKYIYFINYFGFPIKDEAIEFFQKIKNDGIMLIEDTTHSIFSEFDNIGDFMLCSLRKWAAIPDGGILYSKYLQERNNEITINNKSLSFSDLRLKAMILKSLYINGIELDKKEFLSLFSKAEEEIDNLVMYNYISNLSLNILKYTSKHTIYSSRIKNYDYLNSYIDVNTMVSPVFDSRPKEVCPLGYPVYSKDRDSLKKYLIANGVFTPIHWPLPKVIIERNGFETEKNIYSNILTIPIDQRYDTKDMDRIITLLSEFRGC